MENIHNSWLHFNKKQKQWIKKSSPVDWNQLIENHSRQWGLSQYPQGEYWKYINYNKMPTTTFTLPEGVERNQLFTSENFYKIEINDFSGFTSIEPCHLPEGVQIHSTLDEINGDGSSIIENLLLNPSEKNPFSQSAMSFISSGLVLRIEDGVQLDKPIKIVFNLNKIDQKNSLVVFNLIIDLEANSSAQLCIDVQGENLTGLVNLKTDIKLSKKAQLTLLNKEKGGLGTHILHHIVADLEEDALLRSFDVTLPSLWSRHNLTVNLRQAKAKAELMGAYLNNKNHFSDHHTEINHWHKETTSLENYRGLLTDQAKAVFNGKIFIEKMASKSNAELTNKNLMLSKRAEVYTKPELQIYNDDVKAAHGATVGSMDPEQKFYLQSRGFTEKKAKQILAQAFILGFFERESDELKTFFKEDIIETLLSMVEEV